MSRTPSAETRLLQLLRRLSLRRGDFTLASGERSSLYIDCRQSTLTAEGHALVGEIFLDRIRAYEARSGERLAAVGGMALGAAPLASAVACRSALQPPALDAFLVRKQAKGHGTGASVEGLGARRPGDRAVLVEDVVTTGGSLLAALDATEAAGLRVDLVLALVDRRAGGGAAIQARGKEFQALFDLDTVAAEAE